MKEDLLFRTKALGIRIITLADRLPNKPSGWAISKQIIRSGTSVGANYRATRRAKSKPDFINKFKIAEEECDETIFWFEIIEESNMVDREHLVEIKKEANELLSIFVASIKTLKSNA